METIAKLLEEIMTAIYGKDVRQSIHDAIAQCYADARHSAYLVAVDNGFQGTEEEWLDSLHAKINGVNNLKLIDGTGIKTTQDGTTITITNLYTNTEQWIFMLDDDSVVSKDVVLE